MSGYCLLFILIAAPIVLAGESDQVSCLDQGDGVIICSKGTEVTEVRASARFLTLDLTNYSSIAPDALKDINVYTLNLNLGDRSTCEPRDFDLTPESFNGVSSSLSTVKIACWNVPNDSDVLKQCSGLKKVEFTRSGLTEIPKTLLKGQEELNMLIIEGHNIKTLDDDSFSGVASNVALMFINNGTLESIQGRPFENLTHINTLALKYNKIRDLPPAIFAGLDKLEKLTLEGNQIEKINRNVFTSELHKIKGIDLRNNEIRDIEEGAFYNVPMHGLFLMNNALETLPAGALDGVKELKMLDLSGNKFTTIPSHYFNNLNKLLYLTIEDGALSRIEPFALSGPRYSSITIRNNRNLTELVTDAFNGVSGGTALLKLEDNNIKVIQDNAFRNAKVYFINLWGNPLEDKDFMRWGVGEKINVHFTNIFD